MSSIKKSSNPFQKSNKTIEINMSTLSTAQKQMCIKLLAESNINFEQGRDGFQAQLRVDPMKMTTQFTAQQQDQQRQKEGISKVSPIKKRSQNIDTRNVLKQSSQKQLSKISPIKRQQQQRGLNNNGNTKNNRKQNIPLNSTRKTNHQNVVQRNEAKKPVHPIYTNSKKQLSKTLKLNQFSGFQRLHPYVQLYIYPKKMSFQSLVELIEEIYELYWVRQINQKGNQARSQRQRVDRNIKSGRNQPTPSNKSNKQTKQQPEPGTQQIDMKQHTFSSWVYSNFISIQKEKMKMEQLLVNFLESLNHFSYKHAGIQLFCNFLSGAYQLDALNYFLVIRAMLEQIEGEKIIEKISSYGSRQGVMYKLKLNPYNKFITQEKVLEFLEVCCHSQNDNSQESISMKEQIFQEMTEQMFFEQTKKKNFIHFFEMADILIKEFLKADTVVNSTKLELSMTEPGNMNNSSLNDFLFNDHFNAIGFGSKNYAQNDLELEVTFQVKQKEEQPQCYRANDYIDESGLCSYLPKEDEGSRELSETPDQEQDKINKIDEELYESLIKKYESIKSTFSNHQANHEDMKLSNEPPFSFEILILLHTSITKSKQEWLEFLKSKKLSQERQSHELHFIEQLQQEYNLLKSSNIVSNQFVRKVMTASFLRQAIIAEAQQGFGHF